MLWISFQGLLIVYVLYSSLDFVGRLRLPWLPSMQETQVRSLSWKDPLEEKMATHSSILAWRIPWTEEPGRLQSMGLQRVGYDWATNTLVSCTWYDFQMCLIWFSGISAPQDSHRVVLGPSVLECLPLFWTYASWNPVSLDSCGGSVWSTATWHIPASSILIF